MATRDLKDAEPALQAAYERIKYRFESAFPHYEIRPTCVYRTPEEQMAEFKAGRSRIDGVSKKGMHNYQPSKAIDIGIFRKNGKLPSAYIDDLLEADRFDADLHRALYWITGLLAQREGLRSGNDWNGDGIHVVPDPNESLNDPYHFEVK